MPLGWGGCAQRENIIEYLPDVQILQGRRQGRRQRCEAVAFGAQMHERVRQRREHRKHIVLAHVQCPQRGRERGGQAVQIAVSDPQLLQSVRMSVRFGLHQVLEIVSMEQADISMDSSRIERRKRRRADAMS